MYALAVATLNTLEIGKYTDRSETEIVSNVEEKNPSLKTNQHRARLSKSFLNRLKRQTMQSTRANETRIKKNSQQIQYVPLGYQQLPPSNYMQTKPDRFADSASAFIPFQYHPQQELKVQFSIDPNRPSAQPLDFANNQNLMYASAIDAEPLFCALIPVAPSYRLPALTDNPNYDIILQNVPITPGHAFYNPLKSLFKVCPVDSRRCNDGAKCIPMSKWCDNAIDCIDASDETGCTCRDRIAKERLCDRYDDCPAGEDELGCFGCPANSLSCHDSNGNCISPEERCNESSSCKNNKDEINCSILTNSYTYANQISTIGSNMGYLQRNYRGIWYPVCGYAYSWAEDACVSQMGYLGEGMELELKRLPPQEREFGPFLTESGNFSELITDCPAGVAYVRCPIYSNDSAIEQLVSMDRPYKVESEQTNSTRNVTGTRYEPILGIVGGYSSSPFAWPFIIAINMNGQFYCGGVILTEFWILTAAHCFNNYKDQYYDIEAGILRRLSYSPTRQTRRLSGLIIHENYNRANLHNDIAIGLLSEPLSFNIWVRPVRLPDVYGNFFLGGENQPYPGQRCIAVGWGATREGGSDLDHLQEVVVPIINCTNPSDRNRGTICAGYGEGGQDACQGDSGGPLMCRVYDWSYEWYIGGIVSHGIGCGRRNQPGAYTRVTYYYDWINSVIYNRSGQQTIVHPRSSCPGFLCNKPHPKCLPAKKRCDGIVNCLGAEDEINCPSFTVHKLLDSLIG